MHDESPEPSDRELARYLSQKPGLSSPEKELILDGVLATVKPPRRISKKAVATITAIAAASLLFVLVRGTERDPVPRGGAQPNLALVCESRCVPGERLLFHAEATAERDHVALLARRQSDGALIWYVPSTPEGRSTAIDPGHALLDTAVALGPEHAPGAYDVLGVFSKQPLTREEVRSALERPDPTISVVHRALEVLAP